MNGAGDNVFAGTALSGDEDGGIALRHQASHRAHALDGGIGADESGSDWSEVEADSVGSR